jgi:hypothetical protein
LPVKLNQIETGDTILAMPAKYEAAFPTHNVNYLHLSLSEVGAVITWQIYPYIIVIHPRMQADQKSGQLPWHMRLPHFGDYVTPTDN